MNEKRNQSKPGKRFLNRLGNASAGGSVKKRTLLIALIGVSCSFAMIEQARAETGPSALSTAAENSNSPNASSRSNVALWGIHSQDEQQPAIQVSPQTQKIRMLEQEMQQLVGAIRGAEDSSRLIERQRSILKSLDELIESQTNNSKQNQAQASTSETESESETENETATEEQTDQTTQSGDSGNRSGVQGPSSQDRQREMISKAWGHLPTQVREQLQASMTERFLPQYESLIEAFYRSLAEKDNF